MGRVTLTLPRLGETMEEARVTEWLVAAGTAFKRGDVLLEVETDKTVVEVPAMTDGTLLEQRVQTGDMVALDQPIALVEVEGEADAPAPSKPTGEGATSSPTPTPTPSPSPAARAAAAPPRVAASPAARAAARRAGTALAQITGTGRRGRVTASDIASDIAPLPRRDETAPPVILLHGLFDTSRGWRDLPGKLAAAGHPVLAIDLPGHGPNQPAAPTIDDAARNLAETIRAAFPHGPLRLIGHSLGATLAVRIARLMPDRIDRLVLSAPAGLGARINADFTEGMLAAETPEALARALALLDAGPLSASALAQELLRLRALRPSHTPLAAALSAKGFQQIDITADLARLTCDIRVMFGTADRILDWRDVARLPATVAIHLVQGAGHLPHFAATGLAVSLATASGPAPAERRAAALV